MINSEAIKKIEDFVYPKPRSVQEIAEHIGKNWRTADRYIEEIERNFGTISTRVFREGTRGALKIVFWSSVDKISNSVFQEKLEQDIIKAKRKEDFSAFDIFQYVDANKKKVEADCEESTNIPELSRIMLGAEKQILIFSGNLSFINLNNKKMDMFETFENLIKKGIPIKILCRVDIAGKENIEKMLSLNFKYGKEVIEIRHCENPFRAVIVDNKLLRIKEVSEPTGKIKELNKKLFLYYTIKDKEWAEWASKIFWKLFSSSLSANKRLEEIKKIPYSFK
jgi:hypothetical protein